MKAFQRVNIALMACIVAGVGTLGCNTISGAGKDIQKGGKAVEDAAESSRDDSADRHKQQHTIAASAQQGGSITPTGSTNVFSGSSLTFIATADVGYKVADLLVDGRSVGGLSDLYHDDSSTFTFSDIAKNHKISASFELNEVGGRSHR